MEISFAWSLINQLLQARPIHFSFLVNERILDVVFWEREIGIVWGPCSDVAQVTCADPAQHAYRAGVRVGDVVVSLQKQITTSSVVPRTSTNREGGGLSQDWSDDDKARRSTWAAEPNRHSGLSAREKDDENEKDSRGVELAQRSSSTGSREARVHPHPTLQPGSVRLNGLTYNQAVQMTAHSRGLRGMGGAIYHFIGERKSLSQSGGTSDSGAPMLSLGRYVSTDSIGPLSISNSPVPSQPSLRGGAESQMFPRFSAVFDGNRLAEAMSISQSTPLISAGGSARRRVSRGGTLATVSPVALSVYLNLSPIDALGLFVWSCPISSSPPRVAPVAVSVGGRGRALSIDVKSDTSADCTGCSILSHFLPQLVETLLQLRCTPRGITETRPPFHDSEDKDSSTHFPVDASWCRGRGNGESMLRGLGIRTARTLPTYTCLLKQLQRRMQGLPSSILMPEDCPQCSLASRPVVNRPHCPLCDVPSQSGHASVSSETSTKDSTQRGAVSGDKNIGKNPISDMDSDLSASCDSNTDSDLLAAVTMFIDMCLTSTSAACKLFWLLQTTIIPPSQSASPQKKEAFTSTSASADQRAKHLSGQFGASIGISPRDFTHIPAPPAGTPDDLLHRRSAESLFLLKHLMSSLHCPVIATLSGQGLVSSGESFCAEHPHPRLIYTKTHTFCHSPSGIRNTGTIPVVTSKIVDVLHKQTRLLSVIRRCVNFIKLPNLKDSAASSFPEAAEGAGESLVSLVTGLEESELATSVAPDEISMTQSDSGLFTNPTTRRNAVLAKAIRLAVMADARMHTTPLFPLQSPLSGAASSCEGEVTTHSPLLHGIKITECRVLSSANYPILFGFNEHTPTHQSHLYGGSQYVDETAEVSEQSNLGLRILFPSGNNKPSGSTTLNASTQPPPPKQDPHKYLLFKHDDDLRQDALVIQMFRMMNEVLVTNGLDLGMQFYDVLPTGPREGFVEWLVGAVPLAVVISKYESPDEHHQRQQQASARSSTDSATDTSRCSSGNSSDDGLPLKTSSISMPVVSSTTSRLFPVVATSLDPVEMTIPSVPHLSRSQSSSVRTFFRMHSADPVAAMDRFIKSCAGNSALTYVLGVGDRHLENILLRSSGAIIHCDFGFCFGRDPGHLIYRSKLRFTREMLTAMGGEHSADFRQFKKYLSQAFIILRRHATLLFSALRGMLSAGIGDISVTQSPGDTIRFIQSRLLPDMNDEEAGRYIQDLAVENARALLPVVMDKMHEIASYFR